jgi:hypothetical protein
MVFEIEIELKLEKEGAKRGTKQMPPGISLYYWQQAHVLCPLDKPLSSTCFRTFKEGFLSSAIIGAIHGVRKYTTPNTGQLSSLAS